MEVSTHKELTGTLQAKAELLRMTLSFLKSMTLKCALDLEIPDAIQNHGKAMTLAELHSALSLLPSRKPELGRLLRTLTHYGFLSEHGAGTDQAVYDLTATSRLVISKQGSDVNMLSMLHVQLNSTVVNSSLSMGEWFKQEDKHMPLAHAHGCDFWEIVSRDTKLNGVYNDAMASTSSFYMNFIVENYGDVFQGIESLVDIGGGTGVAAKVISENFPNVKCTVLDLPHVINGLPNDRIVKFVSGDMFNHVPPANAVFLKWILHDWSDEKCIKILKRCKEAIPSKEEGGKVIIVEMVVGSNLNPISMELQLLADMLMLALHGGKERDEREWKIIFEDAGFSSYKITHTVGLFSIIEVYI